MDQIVECLDTIIVALTLISGIIGLLIKMKGTSKVLDRVTDSLEKAEVLERAGKLDKAAKAAKLEIKTLESTLSPGQKKILTKSVHKARLRWQDLKDDIEDKADELKAKAKARRKGRK